MKMETAIGISLAAAALILSAPIVPAQEEEPPPLGTKGMVRKAGPPRLSGKRVPRVPGESGTIGREGAEKGKVRISPGEIPVSDLLKALSELAGVPVFYNSSDPNIPSRLVSFVVDVEANVDLLEQVLAVNGFICRRQSGAGTDWIEVASAFQTMPPGAQPPPSRTAPRFLGIEPNPDAEKDIDPRQVVTLIAGLRNLPVGEALQVVQTLAFIGRGPSSGNLAIKVPTGNLLVVEVPYGQVPYLRGLLAELDRRAEIAARRLEVVKVEGGAADRIAEVVQRIVEGRMPAAPESPEKPAPAFSGTRVVPFGPSGSIVIDAASEDDLRWIRGLIAALDSKKPGAEKGSLRTQVFQLRHLRAEDAARQVLAEMGKASAAPDQGAKPAAEEFLAVPDTRTNSLLVQGTEAEMDRVKEILARIDREAAEGKPR